MFLPLLIFLLQRLIISFLLLSNLSQSTLSLSSLSLRSDTLSLYPAFLLPPMPSMVLRLRENADPSTSETNEDDDEDGYPEEDYVVPFVHRPAGRM